MPRFTEQVESAVEALSANPSLPVDENEFIDASRLVYDGIRDIRKAVLMIRVSAALSDAHLERLLLQTDAHLERLLERLLLLCSY
ncbi:Catenin alpha-1 [Liparis tanakae]|uniref:Catenin alpha-1 n=1 Tax=Liparis tanakae TaxID=230148 RepID=A0A4Z2GRD6_9TELE|nr:Catenin alpha-1 [Liparis tanakae]